MVPTTNTSPIALDTASGWTDTSGLTLSEGILANCWQILQPATNREFTFVGSLEFGSKTICMSRKVAQNYSRRRVRRWRIPSGVLESWVSWISFSISVDLDGAAAAATFPAPAGSLENPERRCYRYSPGNRFRFRW